jgi:hypothetical protein
VGTGDCGDDAVKKRCLLCHKLKLIHYFRPGEWRKAKWNRCTECLRVKKPTGGGKELWRRTMSGVMA